MNRGRKFHLLLACIALVGWASLSQAQEASQWKNRAEYDAFTTITKATDPAQKVELADKYLTDYPETNFPDKVYEMKLKAYQQSNNTAKLEETAAKLLELKPDHFAATYILSYLTPRTDMAQDPAKLDRAVALAQKGLGLVDALKKPPNASDDQFNAQKNQQKAVFHQTAGFVALQKKDYSAAATHLKQSSELNDKDALGFYWLGLAYLSPKPPEYDAGIWAMARATSISGPAALPAATQTEVKTYLTKVYISRHGDEEGLQELLAQAGTTAAPPYGFHVATIDEQERFKPQEPEPEPVRELTVKAEELGTFTDIQNYLQAGGEKEMDTWILLEGQVLPLPGRVVSSTSTVIKLAVAPDAIAAEGVSDVEVTLSAPLTGPELEVGKDIEFEGTITAYTNQPFLLKFTEAKVTNRNVTR